MVLFSWKKIYRKANGNAKTILHILHYVTYHRIPNNIQDVVYNWYGIDWSGENFLVNPEAIFTLSAKEYGYKEVAEYVGLASRRNYAEYKATGKITLDLIKSPIDKDALDNNRLLRIEGNQIHFLLEGPTEKN